MPRRHIRGVSKAPLASEAVKKHKTPYSYSDAETKAVCSQCEHMTPNGICIWDRSCLEVERDREGIFIHAIHTCFEPAKERRSPVRNPGERQALAIRDTQEQFCNECSRTIQEICHTICVRSYDADTNTWNVPTMFLPKEEATANIRYPHQVPYVAETYCLDCDHDNDDCEGCSVAYDVVSGEWGQPTRLSLDTPLDDGELEWDDE